MILEGKVCIMNRIGHLLQNIVQQNLMESGGQIQPIEKFDPAPLYPRLISPPFKFTHRHPRNHRNFAFEISESPPKSSHREYNPKTIRHRHAPHRRATTAYISWYKGPLRRAVCTVKSLRAAVTNRRKKARDGKPAIFSRSRSLARAHRNPRRADAPPPPPGPAAGGKIFTRRDTQIIWSLKRGADAER